MIVKQVNHISFSFEHFILYIFYIIKRQDARNSCGATKSFIFICNDSMDAGTAPAQITLLSVCACHAKSQSWQVPHVYRFTSNHTLQNGNALMFTVVLAGGSRYELQKLASSLYIFLSGCLNKSFFNYTRQHYLYVNVQLKLVGYTTHMGNTNAVNDMGNK